MPVKEIKKFFSLKEGHFLPITNDRIFRIFCRDKNNRRFLAKVINLVTGIDCDLLVDKMVIVDSVILEDRVNNHYNEQDVLISLSNTSINMEMSTNRNTNKRKNEMTAFKYAGNQHKIGEKYENIIHYFYQICFETYNLFNNNLLINEVKLVNVSTGNYEVQSNEFRIFHVNLSDTKKVCYNSEE